MKTPMKTRYKTLTTSSVPNKFWGIALAFLLGFLLFVPQSARGGEIAVLGGYNLLGQSASSPSAKISLSFGKRVVFDFNGGVIFTDSDHICFAELSKSFDATDKIDDLKPLKGNQRYSVGLEIRTFIRKSSKQNNVYLGVGADWLPQLETYYPGVKAVTGYQLSLLKKRNLVMRLGAEYYLYGVVPSNPLSLTTSLGYRF